MNEPIDLYESKSVKKKKKTGVKSNTLSIEHIILFPTCHTKIKSAVIVDRQDVHYVLVVYALQAQNASESCWLVHSAAPPHRGELMKGSDDYNYASDLAALCSIIALKGPCVSKVVFSCLFVLRAWFSFCVFNNLWLLWKPWFCLWTRVNLSSDKCTHTHTLYGLLFTLLAAWVNITFIYLDRTAHFIIILRLLHWEHNRDAKCARIVLNSPTVGFHTCVLFVLLHGECSWGAHGRLVETLEKGISTFSRDGNSAKPLRSQGIALRDCAGFFSLVAPNEQNSRNRTSRPLLSDRWKSVSVCEGTVLV